jgi:ArsR family transcriptional regulator
VGIDVTKIIVLAIKGDYNHIQNIEYNKQKMITKKYEKQSKLFKALMHPVRLAILDELRGGEQCVCHLEATLGYRQAYISQHLMILREAELVEDVREGWNIFYRVVQPQIYKVIDASAECFPQEYTVGSGPLLVRNPRPGCPCPKCNPSGEKDQSPTVEC